MNTVTGGFFRCYSCFTVIYMTRGDIADTPGFRWDLERGELYVNCCRICNHWRHYEPLMDLPPSTV